MNWSLPLEYELMMKLSKLESYLGGEGQFNEQDYLFVNTAYDPALAPVESEYGEEAQTVITDRKKLGDFFSLLIRHGNKHKYILCDITFLLPTPGDSNLKKVVSQVPKLIAPSEYDYMTGKLLPSVLPVKTAQADYITYEGIVSKMRLYANETGTKTLPTIMYEDLSGKISSAKAAGLFYAGSYIPRSVYPRYFFDRERMRKHEFSLGKLIQLLSIGDTLFYSNVIRNRILLIGNFSSDIHPTFIGPMPGSLVLFNTYLTLQAGYHLLHWSWFLFALACFTFISYRELFHGEKEAKIEMTNWKMMLKNIITVGSWCLLISFISGMLFKVHITIILMIVYIEIFRHIGNLKWLMIKQKA
jgi:hypothetical protein